MSGEFERARLLQKLLAPAGPDALVVPNGDDAAVLKVDGQLVITTDALVEGVDFDARCPWDAVGHKALAANISDLAAMGAAPLGYVNTLCLPRQFSDDDLTRLGTGMAALGAREGLGCVGGDLSRIDGPVVISITALGVVAPGTALTRAGARAGDGLYVSGVLGGAAAGLRALQQSGRPVPTLSDALQLHADPAVRAAVEAQLAPTPRPALGRALVGVAHACMDLSDGLIQDLSHLLEASGVGARLEAARLPVHPAVPLVAGKDPALARRLTLAGGEEFELLFTASDDAVTGLQPQALAPITRIGVITDVREVWLDGQQLLDARGIVDVSQGRTPTTAEAADLLGFRHF